jgi:hypothetical protein
MPPEEQPTPAAPEAPPTPPAPPATPEAKPPETPAPAAAAAAKPAPAADVVNLLEADLGKEYEVIRSMEDGLTKGLKYPVAREWLDGQMQDPQFAAFVTGLRGVATKERQSTVETARALAEERKGLNAERASLTRERTAAMTERARLAELINKVPGVPEVPKGGEPDPMSPDPKAQEYHSRKHVAKVLDEAFKPMREAAAAMQALDTKAAEQAALEAETAAAQAFIDKTPDYHVYHARALDLLSKNEVKTIELAYRVAKTEALDKKAAEPPPVVAGPDPTTMSATEITTYEMEHPGWWEKAKGKWEAAQRI